VYVSSFTFSISIYYILAFSFIYFLTLLGVSYLSSLGDFNLSISDKAEKYWSGNVFELSTIFWFYIFCSTLKCNSSDKLAWRIFLKFLNKARYGIWLFWISCSQIYFLLSFPLLNSLSQVTGMGIFIRFPTCSKENSTSSSVYLYLASSSVFGYFLPNMESTKCLGWTTWQNLTTSFMLRKSKSKAFFSSTVTFWWALWFFLAFPV
jgi:hypothetical protein